MNLLGDHFEPGDVIYKLNGEPVKGLRSLKVCGLTKAMRGETTVEEVLRVCLEEE